MSRDLSKIRWSLPPLLVTSVRFRTARFTSALFIPPLLDRFEMSSEQLTWKAPSGLRVSAFFNTTPCQNWSDIRQFFRVTKRATVQDYYDAYSQGLECIARYDETPAEVKDKARAILDNTDLETISAKYDSWSLENEKKKAKHSIAKGFVNLAAGAGALIQDEGKAPCFVSYLVWIVSMTHFRLTFSCYVVVDEVPGPARGRTSRLTNLPPLRSNHTTQPSKGKLL